MKKVLQYAFILTLMLAVCGLCYPLFKIDMLHDKQFVVTIIVVFAIFVLVEIDDRFSRWWRGKLNTFWKMACSYKARAVVRVCDMDEKLFSETLRQFCFDNSTDDEPMEKPTVETRDRTHVLRFNKIDFDSVSFLVNDLVYSERGHRYDAKAWYEFGQIDRDNEQHPLSRQKVMKNTTMSILSRRKATASSIRSQPCRYRNTCQRCDSVTSLCRCRVPFCLERMRLLLQHDACEDATRMDAQPTGREIVGVLFIGTDVQRVDLFATQSRF